MTRWARWPNFGTYALEPNYRVLYNIGQCFLAQHDYAQAMHALTDYLAQGGTNVPEERRSAVAAQVASLAGRVARIAVEVTAGAEVRIDDESVGTAPLAERVVVNPGRHRIQASLAGGAPVAKVFDVAGGDEIRIELLSTPPTTLASAPAAPPPDASTHRGDGVWIGWAITGGLTAGAIATGVLALNAQAATVRDRDTFGVDRSTIDAHRSQLSTLATVNNALVATAAIAAAISLYFTLKSSSPRRAADPRSPLLGRWP